MNNFCNQRELFFGSIHFSGTMNIKRRAMYYNICRKRGKNAVLSCSGHERFNKQRLISGSVQVQVLFVVETCEMMRTSVNGRG